MRSGSCLSAAFILTVYLLSSAGPAGALWEHRGGNSSAELGGSIRTVGALIQYYDEPGLFGEGNELDGLSQTILRFTLEGDLEPVCSYEAHLVSDLTWTNTPAGGFALPGAAGGSGETRYRVVDLSLEWLDQGNWNGDLFLDRLNLKAELPRADLLIGRQAINFSQAYFWNPLDIFLPFDPEAFDRDYKPGVDAALLDIPLGAFSGLILVYAPGRELTLETGDAGLQVTAVDFADEPWYGSALVGRARTNLRNWDLTLQGGKIYGGWQAGGGFSGEIGTFGLRGEATWFTPMENRGILVAGREIDLLTEHAAAVIGGDRRFDNSLHVNVEYLYNGAGGDIMAGIIRQAVGETLSLGKHELGIQASYEISPLLTGSFSWIINLTDSSSLVSPFLSRSLSNESEFLIGAILGFGSRPESTGEGGFGGIDLRSEYGTYPNTFFAEFKLYF